MNAAHNFRPKVFLSASVPPPQRAPEFQRVQNAQVEIEQATIALARAVLSRGGTLVLGAHPSISPLIAHVAGEFVAPAPDPAGRRRGADEGPAVIVHQVSAFRDELPAATRHLEQMGLARFVWHDPVQGDQRGGPGDRPYPLSVAAMRAVMLRGPFDAMVCIGGMEGVLEEARMLREITRTCPVLAMAHTGGAASVLAQTDNYRTWGEQDFLGDLNIPGVNLLDPVPYDFVMQEFVRRLERMR